MLIIKIGIWILAALYLIVNLAVFVFIFCAFMAFIFEDNALDPDYENWEYPDPEIIAEKMKIWKKLRVL